MSTEHAYTTMRILCRLHEQVEIAWRAGRDEDAKAVCRIIGALEVRIYGSEACNRHHHHILEAA